ncbi:MAG: ABC transporter permease [Candidatus Zixiibacteriota bacterium]
MPGRGNISFGEGIGVATAALRANKMRAGLTMLGIIIGVAAMITMVALGSGAKKAISARINALGADLLFVRAGAQSFGGVHMAAGDVEDLEAADVAALRNDCPSIVAVVPEVNGAFQVKYENKNWNTRVTGTLPDYEWVRSAPLSSGSYFTNADNQRRERVCVLGQTVVDNLFDGIDPVGHVVRIKGINFEVKGVLQPKGAQGFFNQDDQILIPLETGQYRVMGRDTYSSITLKAASDKLVDQAIVEAEASLRRSHHLLPGQDNDFHVRTPSDIATTLTATTDTFTALLAAIALVSLIVGGIGIMNIMLVSVTERTREIGVRMALGARRRDILTQFLIESTTLSIAGGSAGILVGVGAAVVMARFYGWNTLIVPESIVISFGFAALVGIFFGLYPARKAARLDPIEALRYE